MTTTRTWKEISPYGRREEQMMKPRELQEGQLTFSKYTGASRPPNPSTAKSGVLSDARRGGSVRDRARPGDPGCQAATRQELIQSEVCNCSSHQLFSLPAAANSLDLVVQPN